MFVAALHDVLHPLESKGRLGNWGCTNFTFRGQFALAETFISKSFIVEDDQEHTVQCNALVLSMHALLVSVFIVGRIRPGALANLQNT